MPRTFVGSRAKSSLAAGRNRALIAAKATHSDTTATGTFAIHAEPRVSADTSSNERPRIPLPQIINFDQSEQEYGDPPLLLTADHDITGDSIEVGFGDWDSVDQWVPASDPDVLVTQVTSQSVQATILFGRTYRPAAGDYWMRVRLTDSPEVLVAKSTYQRVRIINTGTVTPPDGTADPITAGDIVLGWAIAQSYTVLSASRDGNEAIITAAIQWPDGTGGTFTTDTASTLFPGAIDAYHVTYGAPTVFHTYTQPLVTRDAGGAVTAQPQIVVT